MLSSPGKIFFQYTLQEQIIMEFVQIQGLLPIRKYLRNGAANGRVPSGPRIHPDQLQNHKEKKAVIKLVRLVEWVTTNQHYLDLLPLRSIFVASSQSETLEFK